MSDELVHLSLADGVATITLDSPRNRNALSAQLRRELSSHLEAANNNPQVRVIVLTHTGPVFCAGMDLAEARSASVDSQGVHEFPQILNQIWESPKPVVASLAGPARAGGIGIVAAADLAIAAREVTFAFTEVRIGVAPAVISATVLRRMDPRAAQALFLTGEVFSAEHAVHIGLLTATVEAADLIEETARYVQKLILGGPQALAATKALLNGPHPASPGDNVAAMTILSAQLFSSPEAKEGMAAYSEKRKPEWVANPFAQ